MCFKIFYVKLEVWFLFNHFIDGKKSTPTCSSCEKAFFTLPNFDSIKDSFFDIKGRSISNKRLEIIVQSNKIFDEP